MVRISKRIIAIVIVFSIVLNDAYISGAYSSSNNTAGLGISENTESQDNDSNQGTEDNSNTSSSEDNVQNNTQSNTEEDAGEVVPNTADDEVPLIEENNAPDMEIRDNLTLTSDMTVGELTIYNNRTVNLNGYALNVEGNFNFNSGDLKFNGGELNCNGDAIIEKSARLSMSNINDTLQVDGSLDIRGVCELNNGSIYVKGDFNATKDFKASGRNRVIFCGQSKQTISISDGGYFETVEVCNYSDEGVYIAYSFQCNKLIDNECNISYADLNGVRGSKLSEDMEIDGLYYLVSDTLDLNGYTLTVNGDLVQGGGTIYINGGTLIVNGDYRVQTRKTDEDMQVTYEESTGYLKMDNPEDYIFIGGDYINETSAEQLDYLTDGIMEITGDITVSNVYSTRAFVPDKNHTVKLSGEEMQEIDIKHYSYSADLWYNHIANLDMQNDSEEGIVFNSVTYVSGNITQNNSKVTGSVLTGNKTYFTEGEYDGDIIIDSSSSSPQDLILHGNVTLWSNISIYKKLTINGNLYGGNNDINMYGSEIHIYGNSENTRIDMYRENDYLYIEGDITNSGSDSMVMTQGTFELKGDMSLAGGITASGGHRLLLSGEELQTISNADKLSLATFELQNYSEDGVYADKLIKKDKLIRNNCRLRYGDLEGEFGWTLSEDYVYEGDLVIIDDELNLNGYTLTVTGSLIQMAGDINISGGKLIVDKDYIMQSRSDLSGEIKYDSSSAGLIMSNEADSVVINGSFICESSINNKGKLTDGTMEVKGNFTIKNSTNANCFITEGKHSILFTGNKMQKINLSSDTTVSRIDLDNSSEDGITITGIMHVTDYLNDHDTTVDGWISVLEDTVLADRDFSGNLQIEEQYTLEDSLRVRGSLRAIRSLTVSDLCTLKVDGDFENQRTISLAGIIEVSGDYRHINRGYLFMQKGKLLVHGNASVDYYAYGFNMTNSDDYICIDGNLRYTSYRRESLNNGTIEVGQNLTIVRNFNATGDNKLILNGDSLQVIDIPDSCNFNILELKNYSDEGVYSDTTFNKNKLIRNGCTLTYGDSLSEGVFGFTLEKDEVWEGNLIILDDVLDLNGHTLTVTGNLIQMSGDVKLSGGSLVVEGDYRMQSVTESEGVITYGNSSSRLIMNKKSEHILVKGDFVVQTTIDGKENITDGCIEVKGDIYVDNAIQENALYMTGSSCLVLSGEKAQKICTTKTTSKLYLSGFSYENTSGSNIITDGNILLGGYIATNAGGFDKTIYIAETASFEDNTVNGDIIIYDSYIISDENDGKVLSAVTINGSLYFERNLTINGKLIVNGDFNTKHYNKVEMNNDNSYLYVGGDFNYSPSGSSSSYISAGIIEVAGDFIASGEFKPSGTSKVILSAIEPQVINVTAGSRFNILELNNSSKAGVYSESYFNYVQLIKNNTKLIIGSGDYSVGYKLDKDTVISGDYFLGYGELDLNGYTLEVSGDFVHSGGNVTFNGGCLKIEGDYRQQTRGLKDGEYYWYEGNGKLVMTDKADKLCVEGDFILQPSLSNVYEDIKSGSIDVGGDINCGRNTFKIYGNSKLVLNGSECQNITGYLDVVNLEFANNYEIKLNSDVYVSGTLTLSDCKISGTNQVILDCLNMLEAKSYNGNLTVRKASVLDKNICVKGILTIENTIDISGYDLSAEKIVLNSTLKVNGGRVSCSDSFTVKSYGRLYMQNPSDYVCIGGDMQFDSSYSHDGYLTAGILELRGDFDSYYDNFIAGGSHKTILAIKLKASGKDYIQTVSFRQDGIKSRFNTLVLRKTEQEYVFSRDVSLMANEIVYDLEEVVEPKPVKGITITSTSTSTVTLEFETEDTLGVTGYDIYRNDKKVGSVSSKVYTDTGLEARTRYTYKVYPFNKYKVYAKSSPEASTVTLTDTEAPTIPSDISVKGVTGSSITIGWTPSTDNMDVKGYEIYRDGELTDTVEGLSISEYKDVNVLQSVTYEYRVVAYDEAGNKSELSESVSAKTINPIITKVCPEDYSKLGNSSTELTVYFKKLSNEGRYTVDVEYYDADTNTWFGINSSPLKQSSYNAELLCASVVWDTSELTGNEYDVRYIVKDDDNNVTSKRVTYSVDNVAPNAPGSVNAVSGDGIITITWNVSGSSDCAGYNIYRRVHGENTAFDKIYTESNPLVESYVDGNADEGIIYEYTVTAVDERGNESAANDIVKAAAGSDVKAPTVNDAYPEAGKINAVTEIQVTASDNKALSSVRFEYRAEGQEKWSYLDEVSADTGTAVYGWDTKVYTDGVYYVRITAVDAAGNESDGEYTRRYEIDNTGIAKINLTDAEAGSTYVRLKWEDVTERDFDYFCVEQLINGKYTDIGHISNVLGYTVENLKPDTSYSFRVTGYDVSGNRGTESDVCKVKTIADEYGPVIVGVYPASSSYRSSISLGINAEDNYSVAYASFYYSLDNVDYIKIADVNNSSGGNTADLKYNFDISGFDEGVIYIKFEAYDNSGNKNNLLADGGEIINEYIIDRTAPSKIKNLTASPKDGYVTLGWDKTSDEDVDYYRIYRADMEDGFYTLIKDNLKSANYHDSDIEPGKAYMYKITAVDIAGNVSEDSGECTATASADRTKPEIRGMSPTKDSIIGGNTILSIAATDNAGLSKIVVEYKNSADGIWTKISSKNVRDRNALEDVELILSDMPEDVYSIRVRAVDRAGNVSDYFESEYTLDNTAPEVSMSANKGDMCINISISKPEADDFAYYEIHRRKKSVSSSVINAYKLISTQTALDYVDKEVEPWEDYEYIVYSYDKVGNCYKTEESTAYATDKDTEAPVAVLPDKVRIIAGMELRLDGGESHDNIRIDEYDWDMGDGYFVHGREAIHTYTEAGTYTIKLTIKDAAGNSSEVQTKVQVLPADGTGSINITVKDSKGNIVPYAYVYLDDSMDSSMSYKTDGEGRITVAAKRGSYQAAAFKAGYIPKDIPVIVSQYEVNEYTITLPKGDIVVGDFSVHRMSLQEMVDAGVDFTNPSNLHRVTFTIALTFEERPIPEEIVYVVDLPPNGVWDIEGGGFGTKNFTITLSGGQVSKVQLQVAKGKDVGAPEEAPVITYVQTIQSVSWLKDMYMVELGVLNTADSSYVIENACATLNLPKGVSIAVTSSGQSNTVNMGSIRGQQRQCASWVVKGDTPGDYKISADFSGNLLPFNCDIRAHFETEQTIGVSTYSGLKITIMPESTAYTGENYYIQFMVKNETGRPLYSFTTTFGPYTVPGAKYDTYVIDPETGEKELYDSYSGKTQYLGEQSLCTQTPVLRGDQRISIQTLEDGQTIYGTYSCPFPGTADPEEAYYALTEHVLEVLQGNDLGVDIEVKPIPGHISKTIVKFQQRLSCYGDPVDVPSGAYLDSYEALSVTGDAVLSLDLAYNSLMSADAGELGYGWSHNFESYIKEDYGMLHYYTSPSTCASFINEESLNGNIYGSIDGEELKLSSEVYGDTVTFKSITTGMEGYVLLKNSDGTYTMNTPGGCVYEYDTEGRLSRMVLEDESAVSLTYADNQTIITEDGSGNRLKLDYADGRIVSVSDNQGRMTSFAYTDGKLTRITNPLGENIHYEYDDSGTLNRALNNSGEAFVTNTYDEQGRVISQLDAFGNEIGFKYERSENGMTTTCTAANGDLTVVESDNAGNILKVTAPNGAQITHTYDRSSNKTSTTDAYGTTTEYTYDDKGNITGYNSQTNGQMTLTYDEHGNITGTISDDGDSAVYTYDENNRLINAADQKVSYSYGYGAEGELTSVAREGKGTQSYGYDSTGSLVTSITNELGDTVQMEYDSRGNTIAATDPEGVKTAYEYDLMNRLTRVTYANGGTESYTYDVYGNVESVTDALGYTTSYAYDTAGRMVETVYADGGTESYEYDPEGNITSATSTDGGKTLYEYDSNGHVTRITNPDLTTEEYTYDILGQVTSSKDRSGKITTYTYDGTGKLTSMELADGQTIGAVYAAGNSKIQGAVLNGAEEVSYTYDTYGNITSQTDALGNVSVYNYNVWGELESTEDANGNITTYEYDAAGSCIGIINPDNTAVTTEYDKNGRIKSVSTAADGRNISIAYKYDSMGNMTEYKDEAGNTTRYEYDLNGNTTKIKDAKGNTTAEYSYDCMGRTLQEKDADGIVTLYKYDSSGLVSSAEMTSSLGEKKSYEYTYDEMGRILSVKDLLGNVSSQTYDEMGNVTSVKYPEGGQITYKYDEYSRLTREENSIGSTNTYSYNARGLKEAAVNGRGQETSYKYDVLGRISAVTDELGTISYTFDGNGNILTVTEKESGGGSSTITRTYDCMNRVKTCTDYRGKTVEYGYDELGNMISLTYPGGEIVRYTYYDNGLLESMTDGEGLSTSYTYDKTGNLLTTSKPDGSVESNSYDKAGKLVERILTVSAKEAESGEGSQENGSRNITGKNQEQIHRYSYTYDQWGNIAAITYEGKNEDANGESGGTESRVSGSGVTAQAGAGTSETGAAETISTESSTMTYDECNRMLTYNGEEVRYDEDGNMTYGPLDGEMTEFIYDCRNRLIKAGDTTYEYDAENNRIAMETPEYREIYTVDSAGSLTRVLEIERTNKEGEKEETEESKETETYYYGNGMAYGKSSKEGMLVYHYNHLGSTTAVTDEDGEVLGSFTYGTYGELTGSEGMEKKAVIRFLYNGQLGVMTDDNGQYYMRSRYYNPEIKRFINQDVLTGNIRNSASLNRYSYVEGNPVSYTDPFGLSPFDYVTKYFNPSMLLHTALDILGCLPGGSIFDLLNAAIYWSEGEEIEAIKSLVFAIPGMDLMGKAAKYAAKGGKYAKQITEICELLTGLGYMGSILFAANDFGTDIAKMIDKYMVNEAAFSKETVYELFALCGHGFQLGQFSKPFLTDINIDDFKNAFKDFWNDNRGSVDLPNGSRNWNRNHRDTSEVDTDDFLSLKDNGVVKVNRSGGDRPPTGDPNSYYRTGNGEHVYVYDNNGYLIYDISAKRIKGFIINTDPSGFKHIQPYKLEGDVPDAIKKIFGW